MMNTGQEKLKPIPRFDPHEKYRKKSAKVIGKTVITCYDDDNPPVIEHFGPPPPVQIKRAAKDLFKSLMQSVVRKEATDDRTRSNPAT